MKKSRIIAFVIVLIVTLGLTVPISNAKAEKTKDNGIYKIVVGVNTNKSFEVSGNNKDNNAKVGIWDYGNVSWQKFYFEYKDGYYKITAMHTGKSLTVKNNSIKEGTEIVQSDFTGSDGQKWIVKDSNKNGWIISPLSNANLSISVQNTIQNGAKLILSATKNSNNQMFYLYNINNSEATQKNGVYKIVMGANANKSFEVAGNNKDNNAKIGLWEYGNVSWQKFYFEYKEGYYKITAMHTGKSLTAKNNSIKQGTEIVQTDYTGSDSQKWILRDTHKNGWIISPLSNPQLSISVQNTIQNGAKLILSSVKNNDNQMFYLVKTSNVTKTISTNTYELAVG